MFFWFLCTILNMFCSSFVIESPTTPRAGYSSIFLYYLILYFFPSSLFKHIPKYLTLIFPFRLFFITLLINTITFTTNFLTYLLLNLLCIFIINDFNLKRFPFLLEYFVADALMLQ